MTQPKVLVPISVKWDTIHIRPDLFKSNVLILEILGSITYKAFDNTTREIPFGLRKTSEDLNFSFIPLQNIIDRTLKEYAGLSI